MGKFDRGLITFLVLWGVVFLLGYTKNVTGSAERAKSRRTGEDALRRRTRENSAAA